MSELVSILIPAYNAEKWIAETIKSALAQTWPRKEVIIVDDGSSDNTFKIAKSFDSKAVKVITQQNKGACGSRNKALSFAQGDYIQWLDADDLLAPDKISLQLEESDDGQKSRVLFTSAFGTFFFRHKKAQFKPSALWQDLSPVDWILTKFTDGVFMNPTAWLVSRQLTELAGPWDERLSFSGDDDGEYICRVVSASERVKFVSGAKCYYRTGNFSSLDWKTTENLEAFVLSLQLSIDHLRSVEDSQRSRLACVKYLQNWLPAFYPDKQQSLNRITNLAHELGGTLLPPEIKWEYDLVKRLFGWSAAKRVMNHWRHAKLMTFKNWDRFLYILFHP